MKKLLIFMPFVITLIFTGCATSNVNQVKNNADTFKFEKVDNSDTIYKASYVKKGKHKYVAFLVKNTMDKIKQEVKQKGYNYFQIVSPKSISNFDGFPITNTRDLMSFLSPQLSMPTHELNFLESRKTLMDNQNSQSAVNVPFTIFQDTRFDLVIRLVKEPSFDEIVWNVN